MANIYEHYWKVSTDLAKEINKEWEGDRSLKPDVNFMSREIFSDLLSRDRLSNIEMSMAVRSYKETTGEGTIEPQNS